MEAADIRHVRELEEHPERGARKKPVNRTVDCGPARDRTLESARTWIQTRGGGLR